MAVSRAMIKAAAGNLQLWKKVYDAMCSSCKTKVTAAVLRGRGMDPNSANSNTKSAIDNVCADCKARIKEIVDNAQK